MSAGFGLPGFFFFAFALGDAMTAKPRTISQPTDDYYKALGTFVHQYSVLEFIMQTALYRYAHVSEKIGRAVFSGVKTDAAMSLIRRISEVESWPKERRERLDYLFAQLTAINGVRNDIVHFGARVEDGRMFVTNQFFAHIEERIRETQVSPEMLIAMADDLTVITAHLVFGDIPQGLKEKHHEFLHAPWRYIPEKPKQARKPKKEHGRPRKQQPPR